MRERKTDIYSRDIVSKFRETGDIIEFTLSCMQEAAWMGRFSGRNRFMFQHALAEELRHTKLDKQIKEDWRRRCLL